MNFGEHDMAKEWEKFQSEYKKLQPDIKKHSMENASATSKRVQTASANCGQGEANLAEAMVIARKDGVKGTGLADLVKDKAFKDALGLLDKATSMLTEQIRAFEAFSTKAGEVGAQVAKLQVAIEKDLKGRKDKSESKKDIEALLDQTKEDQKELKKSADYYAQRVNKANLGYAANFQKTVAAILKQAPDVQDKARDATLLPQLFVDRNLKKNTTLALVLAKQVHEACDAAVEGAQVNLAAAAGPLKTAQAALIKLKKLADEYADAIKKFPDAISNSKDKAKIEKMTDSIAKALDGAAREFKGVATTIKKAG